MLWPWPSIWDENFRQHAKRSHTLVPTPPVPVLLLSLLSSGNRSPVSSRNSCWICGTKVSSFYWDLRSDPENKDGHLFQMCSFPTWNFISAGECCTPSAHTLESPLFFHLVGYPWKTISPKMLSHYTSIQN